MATKKKPETEKKKPGRPTKPKGGAPVLTEDEERALHDEAHGKTEKDAIDKAFSAPAQERPGVATDPDFAMRLITTLIRRNRLATSKIKGLALQGVRERVQALLDQLAVERDGVRIVGEKLSQVEIASRVGASRDMISRVFKELQAEGRIRLERKQITLIPR